MFKVNVSRREFTRQFYRNNHWNFLITLLSVIIRAGANFLIILAMQQVIDTAAGAGGTASSLQQSLITGMMMLLMFVISYLIEKRYKPRFISKAMEQYRNHAFERLSRKSISAFSGESTALYISALSNDVNTIENDYLAMFSTLPIMCCNSLSACP